MGILSSAGHKISSPVSTPIASQTLVRIWHCSFQFFFCLLLTLKPTCVQVMTTSVLGFQLAPTPPALLPAALAHVRSVLCATKD